MLETLNKPSVGETKVADAPEVAEQFSATVRQRLGIETADVKSSNTLRVVQQVTNAMRAATEAIQANSDVLANVVTKEQKNMFAGFLKQLRNDSRESDQTFSRNQEKFLGKLAQLQVSLSESLAKSPEDKNIPILLESIKNMKQAFESASGGGRKGGFWNTVKAELFTMPKAEHFRDDSFVRKAIFDGGNIYSRKLKQAQKVQKVSNELEGIEEPLGLHYDSEKNKYTPPRGDGLHIPKKQGKSFRRPDGMANPPTPQGAVQAKGFEPNKKILEDAIQALLVLGKHDKDTARAAALEAMKNGAKAPEDIVKRVFNPNADLPKPEPVSGGAMVIDKASMQPVKAEIDPNARIKFNEQFDADDSPYAAEDSPYAVEPAKAPEENPLDYVPAVQKKELSRGRPVRHARRLGARRGGIAGPGLFEASSGGAVEMPAVGPSFFAGFQNQITPSNPAIGPVEDMQHELSSLTQKEKDPEEAQLKKANETLEEIADDIRALVAKEDNPGSGLLNTITGGGAARGAGRVASRVGAIAAPAAVAVGGLAGGFALGEGLNKMMGQKTATQTMIELHQIRQQEKASIESVDDAARARGYNNFQEWRAANKAKFDARELERANEAATKAPPPVPAVAPQPIIVPQPTPNQTIQEGSILGGVRPTDSVFQRFQDKRWTRTT